ncbi:440_t:CDS:2, partial [Gigaspora rosea]
PKKMLDHKNINNYYLSQTSSTDNIEVPVDYNESNVDSLYEITDSELLCEASVDSDESDIEASTNSVLENMASDFKGFDGEYEPYFSNFTSATIFTWRNRLPLAETRQHNVPLCMNKTPSTYEATKKAFTISPLIHLERILNNPVLMPKMYFGPGIVTKEKQEFWHSELWQDSILFGECEIKMIKSTTFMCRVHEIIVDEMDNNTFKLKVARILLHKDLPNVHSTDNRHIRGNDKELWLVEAKVLKLAFLLSMTESSYRELQELLENEREILLKVSDRSLS